MQFSLSNIPFPWAILISLVVVGIAYFIKEFLDGVIEDEHHFIYIILGFLVLYIGAAFLVGSLNPVTIVRDATTTGNAIISSN